MTRPPVQLGDWQWLIYAAFARELSVGEVCRPDYLEDSHYGELLPLLHEEAERFLGAAYVLREDLMHLFSAHRA
jgi:hypothetical protein